ncbi:DUF5677 domain-containing protein [Rhizobium sp. SG741]|uniref:DUF5677 domain-containing protein n=1 Tax=Rhizobium sp. SG741 TaxID=2587114 RepID=UPI00144718AB|nr:DUF5677 domain-containing protein [Rhizobium sp. SG741]NKJ08525.1 hypothetical protein [Rhizobium sp. SG741]
MANETRKPVLHDHVAVKRKLVPSFLHKLGGKFSQYSWTRQLVPEAIWIGLLIDSCGYKSAWEHACALGKAAIAAMNGSECPPFVKFSTFAELSDYQKEATRSALDQASLMAIRQSLAPLAAIIPDHPLAFLGKADASPEQNARFPELLGEFYDRNSRAAVRSTALGYGLGLDQEKIHISSHLIDDLIVRFNVIEDYPETEESRQAAGAFRAAAPMLFMSANADDAGFESDAPWIAAFWDHISGFGPCLITDTLEDETTDSEDPFELFIFDFRNAVRADLRARLAAWPLDLIEIEVFEVVTALLCRQATLTMEMASSPGTWTPHVAPILLRAIADVFINLAWILKDPSPRARLYVEDGQGAIKLQIAHQKRALEAATDANEAGQLREMIEMWSDWLSAQRIEALVEVNLGSWSGLNTRRMAEEAGFLDFYNYVYQPFSSAVHSNWAHVSVFNTVHCQNPAHRWHRSAAIAATPIDPNWLHLASKYLSKTFAHFDDVYGFDLPNAAFDLVASQLSETTEENLS